MTIEQEEWLIATVLATGQILKAQHERIKEQHQIIMNLSELQPALQSLAAAITDLSARVAAAPKPEDLTPVAAAIGDAVTSLKAIAAAPVA